MLGKVILLLSFLCHMGRTYTLDHYVEGWANSKIWFHVMSSCRFGFLRSQYDTTSASRLLIVDVLTKCTKVEALATDSLLCVYTRRRFPA